VKLVANQYSIAMPLKLSSPVTDVPRVGPAKAAVLARLGITHVRDFLYTFPRRYDDFSTITPINKLVPGQKMTVRGTIASVKTLWGFRGRQRLLRIFVKIKDDTGTLDVTWYNLSFLAKQLWQGRELFVAGMAEEGKRGLQMRSPVLEFIESAAEATHTARITPVYPETSGVTSRFLRYNVKNLLPLVDIIPEYLPDGIRERQQLMGIHHALREVHFPSSSEELARAQQRLRFDELFFLQLAAHVRRQQREQHRALPIPTPASHREHFIKQLPFTLTGAQAEALTEVETDLARQVPMNRLLQGDVGSGKSAVALYAASLALAAHRTTLYLAPTEILARQQAASFADFLGKDKVALLVGSLKNQEKQAQKQRLERGEALCVVGTHALLHEDVRAPNCVLVIADEQHRFGVAQRSALQQVRGDDVRPHLLSMTATPIPRTLNLTVFGDLDISLLQEMPRGRKPVITKVVAPNEREAAVIHILEELHAGHQGFVIAPLIEGSAKSELKSAKQTFVDMQQWFPDIAVGLLHGQLPPAEKESVIRHFNAGATQLLVSTSVVEVGVNVPNATVMIIEGAERFGLAQLHQFRGRVGRSDQQSYCYLFPTEAEAAKTPRLQVLAATVDGFKIAEEDLRLRGPGELYGVAQSGFGNLQVASLLDYPTIKAAQTEAKRLLKEDPGLKRYPILQKKVEQKNAVTHFE
jgi:ATP-dependent DNA helicase RecG